jgi:GNAT superfamily N-acetyltransferase
MATARSWRHMRPLDGPEPVRTEEIGALNQVFSDAFTERYRRDGMVGVRVPFLNQPIWRYAIEDAAGGAMLWRGERGEIAAFNIAHCSGVEGWMGPLAVKPEYQGAGSGKEIVRAGIEWLRSQGAATIGLETMPRTMDNIGFYSALGFEPGRLASSDYEEQVAESAALVGSLLPGYDFTRELRLTNDLALGDTVLLHDRGALVAYALCHTVPLVEGRAREELRVLKMVVVDGDHVEPMLRALADYARRSGTRRVAFRVQGEYLPLYQRLIAIGARVRWTDLRMTVTGYPEPHAESGVVLSNWEI